MKQRLWSRKVRVLLITLGGIVAVVLATLVAIYLWPLRSDELQSGTSEKISYQEALDRFSTVTVKEKARSVIDGCDSKLYSHGKKTTKSVVMFHGITACSSQFSGLARTFYDKGYNVYVPTAPHHGQSDPKLHGEVRSKELVDYVNESVTIASALGSEVGAVGLSGGGMLATWAAEYRTEVSRALVLSPFYEPSPRQAPKWQLPVLNVLYGLHVLPDQFTVPGSPDQGAFSYRALGNYNIITKNLKDNPSGLTLTHFSTIIAADDDQIDLQLAQSIPQDIANANPSLKLTKLTLPSEWKLGHDIVSLENVNVAARSQQLFTLYLDTYEGRSTDSAYSK